MSNHVQARRVAGREAEWSPCAAGCCGSEKLLHFPASSHSEAGGFASFWSQNILIVKRLKFSHSFNNIWFLGVTFQGVLQKADSVSSQGKSLSGKRLSDEFPAQGHILRRRRFDFPLVCNIRFRKRKRIFCLPAFQRPFSWRNPMRPFPRAPSDSDTWREKLSAVRRCLNSSQGALWWRSPRRGARQGSWSQFPHSPSVFSLGSDGHTDRLRTSTKVGWWVCGRAEAGTQHSDHWPNFWPTSPSSYPHTWLHFSLLRTTGFIHQINTL